MRQNLKTNINNDMNQHINLNTIDCEPVPNPEASTLQGGNHANGGNISDESNDDIFLDVGEYIPKKASTSSSKKDKILGQIKSKK